MNFNPVLIPDALYRFESFRKSGEKETGLAKYTGLSLFADAPRAGFEIIYSNKVLPNVNGPLRYIELDKLEDFLVR